MEALDASAVTGPCAGAWRGRCLPPDQRVLTPDGYRPIAELDARDLVITAYGRPRLVVKVAARDAAERLYRLCTAYGNVLRVTGEHPVLSRRGDGAPEWLGARALAVGDMVAVLGRTTLGSDVWGGRPEPLATPGGHLATVLREEHATYGTFDWVPLQTVDALPYAGVVYDLDVEEDHTFISEGIVLSACSPG